MFKLPPVTLGHPATLEKKSLFWAVRYLANYAQLKRNHMIKEIDAYQTSQHTAALKDVAQADKTDGSPAALYNLYGTHADEVMKQLWDLNDGLMFKYADGYDGRDAGWQALGDE